MVQKTPTQLIFLLVTGWMALTGAGMAVAQNAPRMVKEIDRRPFGNYGAPQQLTSAAGKVFFSAEDRSLGSEPWCTDGTPGGTRRLLDLFPGGGSSSPNNFVADADGVFFMADDSVHGREWWWSDGTEEGTRLISDAIAGPQSTDTVAATVANGRLFYFIRSSEVAEEFELWTGDGSSSGMQMVAKGFAAPLLLTPCGDEVYFFNRDPEGRQVGLWSSDGSFAGTKFIRYVDDWPGTALEAVAVGSRFFFITGGLPGYDFHQPKRLWTSDGTESGTVVLRGGDDSVGYVTGLVPAGDRLFFISSDAVTHGEVWVTDGTVAGTRLVKDVVPGSGDEFSARSLATAGGGRVIFEKAGRLWISDGSEAGTRVLSEDSVRDEIIEGESVTYLRSSERKRLMFSRVDGESGTATLLPATAKIGSGGAQIFKGIAAGDDLYVVSRSSKEFRLWRLPAEGQLPVLLRDFEREGIEVQEPLAKVNESLAVLDGSVFFAAESTPKGSELWSSDGSAKGTRRLTRPSYWPLVDFESYSGKVYALRDDVYKRQLIWTSGSARGSGSTRIVTSDIGLRSFMRASLGGEVFYGPLDGTLPQKLMRTNGTAKGTRAVLPSETPVVSPAEAHIFSNFSPETGSELWICDGSQEGTKLLVDIYPGENPSVPRILGRVGNQTFFTAVVPGSGHALHVTEGTAETTRMVEDLSVPPSDEIVIRSFIAYKGEAYFIGSGLNSHGLWKSDGTANGTVMVKELAVNQDEIKTEEPCLTEVGGMLFFNARGEGGRELWKSDGTEAGTMRVADIRSGALGSDPRNLYSAGGKLYFSADDGVHGFEIWTSDGTEEGTRFFADVTGDGQSSYPESFTVCGEKLFFFAQVPGIGRELHVID